MRKEAPPRPPMYALERARETKRTKPYTLPEQDGPKASNYFGEDMDKKSDKKSTISTGLR
jgi:hypothetical protein